MHNSPQKNLEFQIAFTETNIRYLLGETPINFELIERHKQAISEAKTALEKLQEIENAVSVVIA